MTNGQAPPYRDGDAQLRQFFLWLLATLRLSVQRAPTGVYRAVVPTWARPEWGGREILEFTFQPGRRDLPETVPAVALDAPFFEQVIGRVQQLGDLVHAVPRGQPVGVHELTPCLFDAYTVAGGNVRLAGCTLETTPLLRYTYRVRNHRSPEPARLVHVFASPQGAAIDGALLAALHTDDLEPLEGRPPRLALEETQTWLAEAQRWQPPADRDGDSDLLVATVVWCKHAQGKLLFEIGDARAELAFAGWAQLFADHRLRPPPYTCPHTGQPSYHIAATDDGRVTVAEAVSPCSVSGRRVLARDLERCAVTGRDALPEFLDTCPVTASRVLRSVLAECRMCRQRVSPQALQAGRCLACQTLRAVPGDDPRIARVLGEYPKLERWSRWRLAETRRVYILAATAFVWQLLVVLDKDSLDVLYLATGARLARNWSEIPAAQWKDYIG